MSSSREQLNDSGALREMLEVTRYRLRNTVSRRWGDYALIVVLLALVGGIAMGSVAAGRRTQSSYPAFLASTNASDLTMSTYGIGNSSATNYSPKVAAAIAALPVVKKVESWVGVFATPLEPNGAPNLALGDNVNFATSKNGLYFDEDRVTPIQGRLADPARADEFMTTALGAKLMGIHLNEVVPVGVYYAAQAGLPGFGSPRVAPHLRIEMKLVGIVEFNNQVIEDDTDRLPTNVVYTPALARLIPNSETEGTWYGIQLRAGVHNIAAIEQQLLGVLGPGGVGNFSVTAATEAKVERAVEPESIALGIFGLIAAATALVTALSMVARQLRSSEHERELLRALGAAPLTTLADTLAGLLGAILAGAVLACVVAVLLSPLAPFGPISAVYHPGVSLDWTVLGGGLALFLVVLGLISVALAVRVTPQRQRLRTQQSSSRPSLMAHAAAALGLPLPAAIGMQFAVESRSGRTNVPARWVLAGAVVAVTTVAATLTFSASLHTLVTHPRLYGWNWSAALMSENDIPPAATAALSKDPDVTGWSGYSDPNLQINRQTVPALTTATVPSVGPPILSGHDLQAGKKQVVLGAATLALLHVHLGDTVSISYGTPNTAPLYLPPQPAVVVGTATFPAIAGSSTFAEHTSMGTGALIADGDLPAAFLNATRSHDPVLVGPSLVFVRFRPNLSPAAGHKDLQRIVGIAAAQFAHDPQAAGDSVIVLPVQRPAEIVNYQSTGATPEVLAGGLAAGAILALAVALIATVRKRRHDLALLKTLGFTKRQLAVTLSGQATVTAVIGIAIGLPLGIALGRQLWILFAEKIDSVPDPSVPWSLALVAAGGIVLANLVAALPGRVAATTPAAVVLREE